MTASVVRALRPTRARRDALAGRLSEVVGLYVLSILGALALSAVLVSATGGSWRSVLSALIDGSIRNPGRWGTTIGGAIPLLTIALGTIVNAKAGLVNIGQEGQLLLGGACAAIVAVHFDAPGALVFFALAAAGVAGGAVWAGLAAALRYWRDVPEVLTTLLLVAVASQVVAFGFSTERLLLAPLSEGQGTQVQQTLRVPEGARLPRITLFGNEFPIAAFAAVILAAVVAFILARTVWGFRLRMLGSNQRTATRAGVRPARYGITAMLISGGLAGLAGVFMLTGGDFGGYRFSPGFSINFGWTGLLVALVARERAGAAVVVAFVFACLWTGSGFLAATGVERRITDVVQASLVLALLIPPAVLFIRARRRAAALRRVRV
ncbi:MAG: ABC transporter permease [Acidimicrobiaceae bacterium]|nr:ABC transporter permease [Acidimicrobiaceae bacterium]MYF44501.1 ABC transporter permease [Acidimicrobiaceae bacterium]MYJ35978.1 ABC transporter permease [Acidimicrobiaceae bacterium]